MPFTKAGWMLCATLCGLSVFDGSRSVQAQTKVDYFEKDGIRYQETRQVIRRPITDTQWQAREQTIYRDKYSTDFHPSERRYMVPVTEYRWEPEWVNPWNPFAASYVTYRWVPVTRWVERSETVRIPITRKEVIPEKITTNVPVTTQRYAEEEYVSRVAIGPVSGASGLQPGPIESSESVANRPIGGRRLESDPPRVNDEWRPGSSLRR